MSNNFFDLIKAQKNNIYVFIDASNIWEAQKAKGKFLDFEKLKDYIVKEFNAKLVKFFFIIPPIQKMELGNIIWMGNIIFLLS